MDDAEAIQVLQRSALQHDCGIICSAAMWGAVVNLLDRPDPGRVLGLTSPECQAALRRIYREQPWSLQGVGRDAKSRRIVRVVEAWCRVTDSSVPEA